MGITHEKEDSADPAGRDWLDVIISLAKSIADAPTDHMDQMYQNLALMPFARKQYGNFLKILAAGDGNGAVLWHCTAGKDRVGVGTALLLSILGVDRQLIVDDYMKTNDYYREQNEAMEAEVKRRTGSDAVAKSARGLYSVRESYIRSVFAAIEEHYGSMEQYFSEGLLVTTEEQERLRQLYLI